MTKEKAIEMLKSKMDGHTDTSYEWAETVRMAIKALEQQRTGHWIDCEILNEVKCSSCRMCFGQESNYCPNCGAKMKGVR